VAVHLTPLGSALSQPVWLLLLDSLPSPATAPSCYLFSPCHLLWTTGLSLDITSFPEQSGWVLQ
jgi:hypothetical protein